MFFWLSKAIRYRKNSFQHCKTPTSQCTKTNVQLQISSAITYCELTVHLLIFEKTSVLRQLYSYPFAPIQIIAGDIRKTAVFCFAGYLMNAGHFRKNTVSTGDLNRGRRTESRVLFGYFLHDAKSDNSYPFAGSSEVFQTSEQHTQTTTSHKTN